MPQRDDYIDELYKTDALLQFALMHDDQEEVERLRAKLWRLSGLGEMKNEELRMKNGGGAGCECKPVWNGEN